MKPTLLVIDHIFHTKTRSFEFLFDLLKSAFELLIHYVDPAVPFSLTAELQDHDHVLICQLDFLTPFFIALRKKVVVIQMYDGSGGLPDAHWIYNRQASYINFSLQMHLRALRNGCRSILLKYYPDPSQFKQVKDFSSRRAFFWERLPKSNINSARIASLLNGEIDSIHIHRSSDDNSRSVLDLTSVFETRITTSEWFEDKADFESVLNSCNLFIAPRVAEGIGHAFLEAMAKGFIVMANDLPTHNEYIANWQNGILFDAGSSRANLHGWHQFAPVMGEAARASMISGFAEWQKQTAQVLDFIAAAPRSDVPDSPFLLRFAKEAMAEYQDGFDSYCTVLTNNPFPVQVAGNWASLATRRDREQEPAADLRRGIDFVFGKSMHDHLLRAGWSEPEVGHVWATEKKASVMLATGQSTDRDLVVVIEVRALMKKSIKLTFADRYLGLAVIDTSLKYYVFSPLISIGDATSVLLQFEVDLLDVAAPDPRLFAFLLRSIRLVPADAIIDQARAVFVDGGDVTTSREARIFEG